MSDDDDDAEDDDGEAPSRPFSGITSINDVINVSAVTKRSTRSRAKEERMANKKKTLQEKKNDAKRTRRNSSALEEPAPAAPSTKGKGKGKKSKPGNY